MYNEGEHLILDPRKPWEEKITLPKLTRVKSLKGESCNSPFTPFLTLVNLILSLISPHVYTNKGNGKGEQQSW
jgi:hypothetical protein